MSYIKKNELIILSQAIAFARDYIPDEAIWKWDEKTSWAEMIDKANKTIWDLQTRYKANEQKLVERITAKRKDNPEYKKKHCEASKKYYKKHKTIS